VSGEKGGDALLRRKIRLARAACWIGCALPILMAVAANRSDVVEAQRLNTVSVSIIADGAERQVRTAQTTVGATLTEAGIRIGPQDVVTPATGEKIRDGLAVTVVRVREEIETLTQPIPFETVKTFVASMRPGAVKTTRQGRPGEKLLRYQVLYVNGRPVKKAFVGSEITKKPESRVLSIGSRGRYTSRGEYRTHKVMRMLASAYDPGPRSCGRYANGRTACGLRAGYGVVAVDTRVIPAMSRLYIEGYGYAIAGDRGRAIKGNRIDLGYNTYREAIDFGKRYVTVHVLKK